MSVVARRVRATPHRTATETWKIIVDLLAPRSDSAAREELVGIAGIASSLITDEALKGAAAVVWGSGPRVRIYCLYDEDAITGDSTAESALTFCPTEGSWQMSLPCPAEDLDWVQAALKKRSTHVTARDMTTAVQGETEEGTSQSGAVIDREAFLRS
jgi:hypothetical protein